MAMRLDGRECGTVAQGEVWKMGRSQIMQGYVEHVREFVF